MAYRFDKLALLTERMVAAAQDPLLTEALSWFGMSPERVDEIQNQLLTCKSAKEKAGAMLANRKAANKAKKEALQVAKKAWTDLAYTIRALLPKSEYHSMLNMQTTYTNKAGPETEMDPGSGPAGPEEEPQSKRIPRSKVRSEAAFRVLLPQTLNNLESLPPEHLDRLTTFGWGPERIADSRLKLETYLAACETSERADREYRQHILETREKVAALTEIYRIFSLQIRRNTDQYPDLNRHLQIITKPLAG